MLACSQPALGQCERNWSRTRSRMGECSRLVHRPRLPPASRRCSVADSQRVYHRAPAGVAGCTAESSTRKHRCRWISRRRPLGRGWPSFTRYAKVIESDGSAMTVRTALGIINQFLDEVLAEQEGEFDADTRWALAWFEQFGMEEGPFGMPRPSAKPRIPPSTALQEAGIIKAERQGAAPQTRRTARRLEPSHRQTAHRWEVTQHLIRTLGNMAVKRQQPPCFNNSAASAKSPATWPTGSIRSANARNGRTRHWPTTALSSPGRNSRNLRFRAETGNLRSKQNSFTDGQ